MDLMREEPKLERLTVIELSHTRRTPGEWIGRTGNNQRIHIVATPKTFRIALGDTLINALMNARENRVETIRHDHINNAPTTQKMLDTTKLNVDCEVKEREVDG
jgi:hypothetical protein